jgi:hypothetical protein
VKSIFFTTIPAQRALRRSGAVLGQRSCFNTAAITLA